MKKSSITKKVSLFLTAFAVCLMTLCVSLPVKAAGVSPFALTDAVTEAYPTTNYIYLETAQDMGASIPNTDLKYSTTDSNVTNGTGVVARQLGTSGSKYIYVVNQRFAPAATVYLKYQDTDVLVGVTAPDSSNIAINQTGATTKSATISWTKADGADGYNVYIGTTTDNVKEVATNVSSTSYTISGLSQDGKYVVAVLPYKSNGKGFSVSWLPAGNMVRTLSGKISGVKLSASNDYNSQYKIVWNEKGAYNADGFEILITNKSGKKITSATETSYLSHIFTNKKLRTQGWKVKVRAYTVINGKKVPSAWSSELVVVPNAYVKSAKLVSKKGTDVKLTWAKVSGAKNYTIYRSTSANGGFKKVATVKGTSYTMKNLAKYKNYYIYVKANKVKVGKKSYNSTSKNPSTYSFIIRTSYY